MKTFKRIFSILLALTMCFAISTSAFAAEASDTTNEAVEVTSDTELNVIGEATCLVSESGVTVLSTSSSVSGYNQKTISGGSGSLVISCDGTGTGGMGITIQSYCSYGDYSVDVNGYARRGNASSFETRICTNNPYELHNQWQDYLTEYVVEFEAEAGTPDYLVKVWIYG